MYEYHGWINLRVTPGEVDNEEKKLWAIHQYAKNLIETFAGKLDIAGLHIVNGEHLAWFSGCANHSSLELELINIFRAIGNQAPGSYGLLYIWDNEAPNGLNNEFQTWRLVRGKLDLIKDSLLSPCIPIIEDPED